MFYCFAPVRKYVLEAHRQAIPVVASRSLREPRNSLPRSCQAKGRKSPIQAKSTYFLRGKSLDGREHGDLERQAHSLKLWPGQPVLDQPSPSERLSSSQKPSIQRSYTWKPEWCLKCVAPKEQISSVRYVIVFKSPTPGLSSPTNTRETHLGQPVGA